MNEKGRQTKLLAAIAIIAMVVCVFAVVMPTDEVNGATIAVDADTDLQTAIDNAASGDILNITEGVTIDDTITINKNITITSSNGSAISRADSFHDGDMFDITTSGKLTLSGDVVIDGNGSFTKSSEASGHISSITSVTGRSQGVAFDIDGDMVIDGSVQIKNHINEEAVDSYIRGVVANVASTGSLEINGGTISDNLGIYAEGATKIWVQGVIYSEGDLKITGGEISDNVLYAQWTANADNIYYGAFGTVYAASGTITMTGGTISNNTLDGVGNVSSAGAINVGADVTSASIGGVNITGNYSSNGGALNLYADTTISNVTINNNLSETAADEYIDIYAGETGSVTFTGANTIGYITLAGNSNSVSGTLAVTALTNTGTLTNNGTITGTIDNTGTYNISTTTTITSSNIESIVFANADNVTLTSGTISGDIAIPTGKTLIIGDNVTLDETTFTITADTDFVGVDTAAPKSFSVEIGSNTISFTDIIGKVVITKGSIYINDAEYDGFSGKAEVDSADGIEINGKVSGTFDLTVANTSSNAISIKAGDKLIIETGATLNIILKDNAAAPEFDVKGTLDLYGGITYDGDEALNVTKSGSGVINIYSGSSVDKVTLAGDFKPEGGQFEFGDTLNSSYTVTTDEYLSQDLTIPTGVTLTIGSGANLNLAGHNIYVYGTLDIQANGSISGTASGDKNTVYLMRNGVFTNAGTIGEGTPVTVAAGGSAVDPDLKYTATGSVVMQNITGISFGLANTGVTVGGQASYILTVTGNVQSYGLASAYTAEFNGVRIIGDLYVGQDITVNFVVAASTVMSSATLTVDGAVNAGTRMLIMANNSTIVVNGNLSGTIAAQTGDYKSGSSYADLTTKTYTTFTATVTSPASTYLAGYTLTVGTYEFQQGSGSNAQAMIAQRLYVDGAVSFVTTGQQTGNPTYNGHFAIGGSFNPIVAEGTTLSMPTGMKIQMNDSLAIEVQGEINFALLTSITNVDASLYVTKYEGSSYSVTVTTPARATTGYIVPFESAMGAIETADNKKVTVMGDLEIVSDLTITTGQTLDISKAVVTIDEDAEVILQTRAILTGPINDVDGMFTAYNGATYVAPTSYDTYERGTDYVRYSGIVAALDNAVAGDVIDVTRPVTGVEDLTIPQGVTVNASANITIDGDLVVETEATLKMTNSSTLLLNGEKSTATVNGTLNLEEGTISFTYTNDDNSLASAGTTVMTGTNFTAVSGIVDGAVYTNEDSMRVITNAVAALAAAAAQDVNKTVYLYGTTSSGDLTAGVDIIVDAYADATVSSIALADGETITLNGKLTGAVTVQTGVAGSESASTIDLNKASGIVITAGSVTDNQGVRTYELQLADATGASMAGKVTVSAGTANIATSGALTVNGDGVVLTVASGATLIVGEGETLNVGDAKSSTSTTSVDSVVVEGTLVADKGTVNIGYTTYNGFMLVSGTFQVADETDTVDVAAGSTLTVTGTLDISTTADKEAVIAIDGILVVGEKPNTVGALGTGVVSGAVSVDNTAAAYIKAYNGSDLSAALINIGTNGETTIDSTAFYINSELYMTVYAEGNVAVSDLLTNEKFSLVGYLTKYGVTQNNTDGIDIEIITDWYTDAEMSVNYNGSNAVVGNPDALYFKAQTATVDVVISVGTGISLYIDNIKMTSGVSVELAVGTHTVSATVDPGYTGTTQVMFNGNVVSGSFEITADMASGAYEGTVSVTATGDIQQQTTVIDGGNSGDSSMSLTDYLLIILVVLIVVMAIIVALRLMRS